MIKKENKKVLIKIIDNTQKNKDLDKETGFSSLRILK